MAKTRDELQRLIDALSMDLPKIIEDNPEPGDFSSAFAGRADEITDNASAEDDAWAFAQLDAMLDANGHPSQENELPPDE